MPETEMMLVAEWQDDCTGKKDYDGPVVEISSRYWPAGGGFYVMDRSKGELEESADPGIKPSATCTLVVRYLDADGAEDTLDLARGEFKGETFEEVRVQVERFAQEQMSRVVTVLRESFLQP